MDACSASAGAFLYDSGDRNKNSPINNVDPSEQQEGSSIASHQMVQEEPLNNQLSHRFSYPVEGQPKLRVEEEQNLPVTPDDPASSAGSEVDAGESLDAAPPNEYSQFITKQILSNEILTNQILTNLKNAYPDDDEDTVLHMAGIFNDSSVAIFWKDKAPENFTRDLNAKNLLMQTPLHIAVILENEIMIELLMKSGASAMILGEEGRTSIHLACQSEKINTLQVLIDCMKKHEGEVTAQKPLPDSMQTSLQPRKTIAKKDENDSLPVENERLQGEESLAAALNAQEYSAGLNSLLFFIKTNNPVPVDKFQFIDLLIDYGANPNHQDTNSGKTIVHYIADQNNVALYQYLRKHYPFKIDWDAAQYDGSQVTLMEEKEEEESTYIFKYYNVTIQHP